MGSRGEKDLHSAARSGDLISVQTIVSSNPLSVNSRDKHSRTPLHLAAWSGQTEVVKFLCKNKADVGAAAMDDMGAIHFAAQKGHLEVVRALLSSGVSVKAVTRKGFTPLHYAAQGSHMDLVRYLVRKGANLTVKTKAGKTPSDLASNDEICKFLEESEEQSKSGNLKSKEKSEEGLNAKPSVTDKTVISGDEGNGNRADGEKEKAKRKDDEEEGEIREASPRPKKPKVALHHLDSTDDTVEGDEEL